MLLVCCFRFFVLDFLSGVLMLLEKIVLILLCLFVFSVFVVLLVGCSVLWILLKTLLWNCSVALICWLYRKFFMLISLCVLFSYCIVEGKKCVWTGGCPSVGSSPRTQFQGRSQVSVTKRVEIHQPEKSRSTLSGHSSTKCCMVTRCFRDANRNA